MNLSAAAAINMKVPIKMYCNMVGLILMVIDNFLMR